MSSRLPYSAASLWQPRTIVPSAWIQHAPFGFWIIDTLRPQLLVELGTHRGFSYLIFLQAVKALGLRCSCFAIDTWKGDEQTGFYDNIVLQELHQQHDSLYDDFSELLQATFEDAVNRFEDGSIDLLHIDGRHFYDDVKRDFETWKPKLSDRSVVLFHDTGVLARGFGVHRLWEEISCGFPSFVFTHGHGLGVLGFGTNLPDAVREFLELGRQLQQTALVRSLYARLGEDIQKKWDDSNKFSVLQQDIEILQKHLTTLNSALSSTAKDREQLRLANEASENRLNSEVREAETRLALVIRQRDDAIVTVSNLEADLAKAHADLERAGADCRQANTDLQRVSADLQKINTDLQKKDAEMRSILMSRSWRTMAFMKRIPAAIMHPRNLVKGLVGGQSRKLILKSGLFDVEWYRKRYPDVQQAGIDPIEHYLQFGASEGRNPTPLFDSRWYLTHNPDIAATGENPLVHFIVHGWHESRNPNSVFDTSWYLKTYPDVATAGCNPLVHYLQFGAAEGRDPGPDFDTDWYAAQYPEIAREGINPLAHYLTERNAVARVPTNVPIPSPPAATRVGGRRAALLFSENNPGLRRLRVYNVPSAPRRVTMITDSINSGYLFGGVATAMIFSAMWAARIGAHLRIVGRHQKPDERNFTHVMKESRVSWDGDVDFRFCPLSDDATPIDVGPDELVLTTSWWTTWAAKQALGVDRIVHLLQEDERMFYPFGDERLLCEEVLATSGLKFVVNAKLLYDHLAATGVNLFEENGTWFEPAFPVQTFYYAERPRATRFNFLFYARPNNLRNLFYRGIEVIEQAIRRGILDPDLWDFHFVGKDLDSVVLSGGIQPKIHQNLPWADYAALVRNTDIGLSLMYSPHPSYPPLDLAASGAVVVTNQYGNKKSLDAYSRNIICRDISTDSLVEGIAEAVTLVREPSRRLKNYQQNGLLRDWESSFDKSLDFVSRGVFACS